MQSFSTKVHTVAVCAVVSLLLAAYPFLCIGKDIPLAGPTLSRVLQNRVLRVGINPNFKPFSYLWPGLKDCPEKEREAHVGIDIDISVLLARELGVDLKIVVPETFDHLIPMLQSGEIDIAISAMSRVFERALQVDFSEPYFRTGFSILLNIKKGYRLGIAGTRTYEELKDTLGLLGREDEIIVAVTRGKSAAGFVGSYFPNAKIIEFGTNEKAAEAVAENKSDSLSPHIMVHDETFLNNWVGESPRDVREKLVVFDRPFKPDTYGFAVAKGNLPFIPVLNLFISDKLFAEGNMEKFRAKRFFYYLPGVGIESIR